MSARYQSVTRPDGPLTADTIRSLLAQLGVRVPERPRRKRRHRVAVENGGTP